MRTLYEASNAVEAHMLRDLLLQEGVQTHIHGEALQGALGEVPASGLVRLVVEEESYGPAREIIERWERTQIDSAPLRRPATRSSGPWSFVLGLAIGIGGTYAAYKTPVTFDGIDYDRDGLLDEKQTYSPNGSRLKHEQDRNLDKKVDLIASFDSRGLYEKAESDDNFDGVFESKHRFRNGNIQASESDTDGDGYPDIRSLYSHGVLKTIEYLNPTSGLPLRVEHYRLGRLEFADVDSNEDGTLDSRVKYTKLAEVLTRERLAK